MAARARINSVDLQSSTIQYNTVQYSTVQYVHHTRVFRNLANQTSQTKPRSVFSRPACRLAVREAIYGDAYVAFNRMHKISGITYDRSCYKKIGSQ